MLPRGRGRGGGGIRTGRNTRNQGQEEVDGIITGNAQQGLFTSALRRTRGERSIGGGAGAGAGPILQTNRRGGRITGSGSVRGTSAFLGRSPRPRRDFGDTDGDSSMGGENKSL